MNAGATLRPSRAAVLIISILLGAAVMVAGCQWRPETAEEEAGALNISTLGLDDDAEIRVRFYRENDDVGDQINPVEDIIGGDGGIGYEDLPEAAGIGGRSELRFQVRGTSGNLTVTGIPPDTPYDIIVERKGSHGDRLDDLVFQEQQVEYAPGTDYLSHIGVGEQTIEVGVGDTLSVEAGLQSAALATLVLPTAGNFELLAVSEGRDLDLNTLEEVDSVEGLNEWYENEVRNADNVDIIRPHLTEAEPREQFSEAIPAVIPKRKLQVIVTDYGGPRSPGQGFGEGAFNGNSIGVEVYGPFSIKPGEQKTLLEPGLAVTVALSS